MTLFHLMNTLAQLTPVTRGEVTNLPAPGADASAVKTILTIVFTITGAIAVIIVTIAGIKYSSSQGDPQATAKAKGAIIYAVVGLVVSIFATVIVQFAVGHV